MIHKNKLTLCLSLALVAGFTLSGCSQQDAGKVKTTESKQVKHVVSAQPEIKTAIVKSK